MVYIAICDDMECFREEIRRSIVKYSVQRDFDYHVDEYSNGEDLIKAEKDYDLIFMDYKLQKNGLDGLVTARIIRERNRDTAIIFFTSYPEVVFDSFEVNAFRFLVKPLDEARLFRALDSFVESDGGSMILKVNADGTSHMINQRKILFVRAVGKYCQIRIEGSEPPVECHETLLSIEEILTDKLFFRCHRSYVVNMIHVSRFDKKRITLDSGEILTISRDRYGAFVKEYSIFLAKRRW